MTLEEKYGIEISADLPEGHTVQNLADFVVRLIREQKKTNAEPDVVLHEIMEIIREQSGRWFPKPITPGARLTDVLSM